jgi:hypothetical protein
VIFAEPDEDLLQCVLVTDDSRGADGIVGNSDIRSIAELKGRTVAVPVGSSNQFYLNLLLQEAGLSEADLGEVVDLWAMKVRSLPASGSGCRGNMGARSDPSQECRPWPPDRHL